MIIFLDDFTMYSDMESHLEDLWLALQDFELSILLFFDMHRKIWNNHACPYT